MWINLSEKHPDAHAGGWGAASLCRHVSEKTNLTICKNMITEFQSETNHYICTNISKIAQVECNQSSLFVFRRCKGTSISDWLYQFQSVRLLNATNCYRKDIKKAPECWFWCFMLQGLPPENHAISYNTSGSSSCCNRHSGAYLVWQVRHKAE